MAILIKDILKIQEGDVELRRFKRRLLELDDGEYSIFICNKSKNKSLSQLKYLFGVVLRTIANELEGDRATVNDLYRFFERKYAPMKTVSLNGEDLVVQDLKNCSSKEMGDVIEQIIRFADSELGITIGSREQLKDPEAQEAYVDAYNNQWEGYDLKI